MSKGNRFVAARLDKRTAQRLDDMCEEQGRNTSDVIRRAIDDMYTESGRRYEIHNLRREREANRRAAARIAQQSAAAETTTPPRRRG